MTHTHTTAAILDQLAQSLQRAGISYFLLPMADEFQGEYVPPYAARLPYVTGFTGSAGLGLFADGGTHTLFVDGRYVLQAPGQVDGTRVKVVNSGETPLPQWLEEQGASGKIGYDPWLVTPAQLERWKSGTKSLKLEWGAVPNPVDALWQDRPAAPASKVILQPVELAGESYSQKREALLVQMAKHQADGLLFAAADSINWLLNIRASDVEFNPLLLSYLLVKADGSAVLYTFPRAWDEAVSKALKEARVEIADIAEVFAGKVKPLPKGAKLMADAALVPQGWFNLAMAQGWDMLRGDDPVQLPKALKNAAELKAIADAHARDGVALVQFLAWLDEQVDSGTLPDELKLTAQLEAFRAADATYRGASFATIAGSGPHGAIVHYRADEASNRTLQPGELLLLDSGGQYAGGTTDVTRTVLIAGKDDRLDWMRECFTRVLKGHIAIASARFPSGTSGTQLDVLARHSLWQAGLDYDHGTGHGVGAYLCVHEGPQRISKRGGDVALKPGMIISNEPGYYEAGKFGIRIESLVEVTALDKTAAGKQMLGFKTLTLAPIDTRLIDRALLSDQERTWLNFYHQQVREKLSPQLQTKTREWLEKATRAV